MAPRELSSREKPVIPNQTLKTHFVQPEINVACCFQGRTFQFKVLHSWRCIKGIYLFIFFKALGLLHSLIFFFFFQIWMMMWNISRCRFRAGVTQPLSGCKATTMTWKWLKPTSLWSVVFTLSGINSGGETFTLRGNPITTTEHRYCTVLSTLDCALCQHF